MKKETKVLANFDGVQLIEEDEVLTIGSMDTTHYEVDYRRIPKALRAKILKKFTTIKKGVEVIDISAASTAMLQWMIYDFRGLFVRKADEPNVRIDVPYSTAVLPKIPETVQSDILEAGGANLGEFKGDGLAVEEADEKKLRQYVCQQIDNKGWTCRQCRKKCDDNETDPACEKTGARCAICFVDLTPLNQRAWNLYWTARSPVGSMILFLEQWEVTTGEAEDLAFRMRIIDDETAKQELQRQEAAAEKLKRK